MQKELYYTEILDRKPGNEGFTLSIPAFEELGRFEGDDAEELVDRGKTVLEAHLETYREEGRPIPVEMTIKVKVTLPVDEE